MFRAVVTSAVALALALAVPSVAATGAEPASQTGGQCVLLTFVPSDADEPHAEVQIAKGSPFPLPPEDPEPGDLLPYVDDLVDRAIGYLETTHPTSGSGDVLVDLIVPANADTGTNGYRIGVLVDLSNCSVS